MEGMKWRGDEIVGGDGSGRRSLRARVASCTLYIA